MTNDNFIQKYWHIAMFGVALLLTLATVAGQSTTEIKATSSLDVAPLLNVHTISAAGYSESSTAVAWDVTFNSDIPTVANGGYLSGRGFEYFSSNNTLTTFDFNIDGDEIVFSMTQPGHTGAFSAPTDFSNVDPSATAGGSDDVATISYPITPTSGSSYTVELDISSGTVVQANLTDGVNPQVTVGEFIIPAEALTLSTGNLYTELVGFDEDYTTCSQIVDGFSADIAISVDGSLVALEEDAASRSICGDVQSSYAYNPATYTATLEQISATTNGVVPPKTIVFNNDERTTVVKTLNRSSDGSVFLDPLNGSTNASEAAYVVRESDGTDGFEDGDQYPVVLANYDLTSDVDFIASGVTYGSDASVNKSFAHNLAATTNNGQFTLYVPVGSGDVGVGICPGAVALADVTDSCDDLYIVGDGESVTSEDYSVIPDGVTVSVSKVTLLDKEYWAVSGLTGSGAYSSDVLADTVGVPDTGVAQLNTSVIAPIIAAIAAGAVLVYMRKRLN